jgi:hypothetical protein
MSGQGVGPGTGGSNFNTLNQTYDAVPFGSSDFNGKPKCPTVSGDIQNYSSAVQVQLLLRGVDPSVEI